MRPFIYCIILFLSSCVSSSRMWKNVSPVYFEHIEFVAGDTVLDVFGKYLQLDAYAASRVNESYFYLTCEPGRIPQLQGYINKELEQVEDFNKNSSLVEIEHQRIRLPGHSVSKILCRQINFRYKYLGELTDEFARLLKPGGSLIVELNAMPEGGGDTKRYPGFSRIVTFFNSKGFSLKRSAVLGSGESKSTDILFIFRK